MTFSMDTICSWTRKLLLLLILLQSLRVEELEMDKLTVSDVTALLRDNGMPEPLVNTLAGE